MNTMEQELENVLRAAPRPIPPAGLKERLVAQVRLLAVQSVHQAPAGALDSTGWLRRWWPVLVPAAASLACAVGLTVQQAEIRDLKKAIQDLSRRAPAAAGVPTTPTVQTNDAAPHADAASRTQQEVTRLKALASQLAKEVAQLEKMQAENAKLRTQLETPPPGVLSPEETDALAKAKEKLEAIACVNNLKNFGLSMRTWAVDNDGLTSPDFLSMSNEFSTPKILVCPADHARQPARNWASYTSANCSYEYLVPSVPNVENEPQRVAFRCPIHGHVGLCDGSVQGEVAKKHPEHLVHRDGKLYFQ